MTGSLSLTEHLARSPRHCSFYLACRRMPFYRRTFSDGSTPDRATNSMSPISGRSRPTRSPIRTGSSTGDASATGLTTRWSWTPSCSAPPSARLERPSTAASLCATCSDGPHGSGMSARTRLRDSREGLPPRSMQMTRGPSLTEHIAESPRHSSFYLSCGEEGATPIISWRGQLPKARSLSARSLQRSELSAR